MEAGLIVKKVPGVDLKDEINSFYAAHGSLAKARDTDLYFLAFQGGEIVGAVRFCIEEETPMLRTMMIHTKYRRLGIGTKLLSSFATHLDSNGIGNTYCLPYIHLEAFYSQIGFRKIDMGTAPPFLQERSAHYSQREPQTICMKRN